MTITRNRILSLLLGCTLSLHASFATAALKSKVQGFVDEIVVTAGLKPEVKAFVDEIVKEHALFKEEVSELLKQAEFRQDIINKMTGRAERKSWYQYRPIFLNEKRISQGVKFWSENEGLLREAERIYGVDAAIIVAILGVETYYGKRTGTTKVLDALYTLAFGYPKRAPFFRKELKQFILLSGEAGFDPAKVTGSYAGAMGASQFISSSYRNFAVDFDRDGKTDLWGSKADMIGSIANYFYVHHWNKGAPVAVRAGNVDPNKHRKLFFSDSGRPLREVVVAGDTPNHSVNALFQAGIRPHENLDGDAMAYLMPFETSKNRFDYWFGLDNFYVITRYNRSPLYAMAVYQLSREIAARRRASGE